MNVCVSDQQKKFLRFLSRWRLHLMPSKTLFVVGLNVSTSVHIPRNDGPYSSSIYLSYFCVDAFCCDFYGRPMEQGRPLYFHPVVSSSFFFLSSFYYFSSPILSRRTLDVCRTSTHGVALVRIQNAGLKRAASGSLEIQDAKNAKNSPSRHHYTTLPGYIFATKTLIDNRKNR